MHVQIPVDHLVVSVDEAEVAARAGEADDPEGTAPPIEVHLALERDFAFIWTGLRAPVSLSLARLLVAGKVSDVQVIGQSKEWGDEVSDLTSNYARSSKE